MEDFTMERLEALRDMTTLNPIASIKVLKARKDAEKMSDLYNKYEPNDHIGTDYSTANNLEYSLRMEALERKLENSWQAYLAIEKDGFGLIDFAEETLNQHINKNRGKTK